MIDRLCITRGQVMAMLGLNRVDDFIKMRPNDFPTPNAFGTYDKRSVLKWIDQQAGREPLDSNDDETNNKISNMFEKRKKKAA